MKKKYHISIITPTLNAEKYISNCILSIKKQKNINIQHIIVDAGSNDKTLYIINKFDNLELYNLNGSSIYEALNYGAKFVKSPLIGFLNSDDIYDSDNILNLVVNEFNKNDNDKQIIYGNCKFINNNQKLLYRLFPKKKLNHLFAKIRIFNISHPSWFISNEAFKILNGYDTNLKFISDCDIIIRSLKNPEIKLYYINLDIANFLIHNDNLSRSIEAKADRSMIAKEVNEIVNRKNK